MTAENQKYFDQRWDHLQKIPALIKFISYEPALGPLQLPSRWTAAGLADIGRGKWWRGSPRKAPVDSGCNCGLPSIMASLCFTSSGAYIGIIPSS